MKKPVLSSCLLALILCLVSFHARAVDPTVNAILDIVLQEMAPELKPAKPFVVCLIDTGGNVDSCVKSFLGPAAADAKGQALRRTATGAWSLARAALMSRERSFAPSSCLPA